MFLKSDFKSPFSLFKVEKLFPYIRALVFYIYLFSYFLSSPVDILTGFRERGREGERTSLQGEKRQCERETLFNCLSYTTGDQTCQLGMCHDQDLNL